MSSVSWHATSSLRQIKVLPLPGIPLIQNTVIAFFCLRAGKLFAPGIGAFGNAVAARLPDAGARAVQHCPIDVCALALHGAQTGCRNARRAEELCQAPASP